MDGDMLARLKARGREGRLREVLIGSHDARTFGETALELVKDGVRVVVLGFSGVPGRLPELRGGAG